MQSVKTTSAPSRACCPRLGLDARLVFMVVAIAGIWIVFHLLTGGIFLTARNLWNLSVQTASVGVMVSGMVLIIVMRNIDLSIGSILGFTGMVMAVINTQLFPKHLVGRAADLAAGPAAGRAGGCHSGHLDRRPGGAVLYRHARRPADLSGRGLALDQRSDRRAAERELSDSGRRPQRLDRRAVELDRGRGHHGGHSWADLRVYQQRARRGLPNRSVALQALLTGASLLLVLAFVLVMNSYADPRSGLPRGMPVPVLLMLVVTAIMMWVVRATRFGRYVFAYGGNPEAARLAGINTRRLTIMVFGLMGLLAALAGAIQSARLNAGTNSTGTLAELSVIAAAVIGGTSLSGGTGSIPGAFLGAILMASLINGMLLLDLPSAWQNVVQGLVLMLAVTLDVLVQQRRAK